MAAFAATVVSPFTDSPDCLIIPRSAIMSISISLPVLPGALYNHSGTAVHESSDSENWTRETFSKLVTFHADTFLVSCFALVRPSLRLPFTFLDTFSFAPSSFTSFFALLPPRIAAVAARAIKTPTLEFISALRHLLALYRATEFSIIISLSAIQMRRYESPLAYINLVIVNVRFLK